jgi:predicted transcriptional regulator
MLEIDRSKFIKRRKDLLLSCSEVAKRGDVPHKSVLRFEKGGRVQIHTLRGIIKGLGMTVDEACALKFVSLS